MVKKCKSKKTQSRTVQEVWLGKTNTKTQEETVVLKEFSCVFD